MNIKYVHLALYRPFEGDPRMRFLAFFFSLCPALCLKSMLFAEDVVILARKARWLLLVAKHEAWIMFSHWQRRIARLDGYCKHACNGFDITGTGSQEYYKDRNSEAERKEEVK